MNAHGKLNAQSSRTQSWSPAVLLARLLLHRVVIGHLLNDPKLTEGAIEEVVQSVLSYNSRNLTLDTAKKNKKLTVESLPLAKRAAHGGSASASLLTCAVKNIMEPRMHSYSISKHASG